MSIVLSREVYPSTPLVLVASITPGAEPLVAPIPATLKELHASVSALREKP